MKKKLYKEFMVTTISLQIKIDYDFKKEIAYSLLYSIGRGIKIKELGIEIIALGDKNIIEIKTEMFRLMIECIKLKKMQLKDIKRCGFIDLHKDSIARRKFAGWYFIVKRK